MAKIIPAGIPFRKIAESNRAFRRLVHQSAADAPAADIPGVDFTKLMKRTEKAILRLERAAAAVEAEFERGAKETRPLLHAADLDVVLMKDGKRCVVNLADALTVGGIPKPFEVLGKWRDSRRLLLKVSETARRDVRRLHLLLGKVRKKQSQGLKARKSVERERASRAAALSALVGIGLRRPGSM